MADGDIAEETVMDHRPQDDESSDATPARPPPPAPRFFAWPSPGFAIALACGLIVLAIIYALLSHSVAVERTVSCGNNLKQIALAMRVYFNDESGWPVWTSDAQGRFQAEHPDPLATTHASFEVLQVVCGDDGLTPMLFLCPEQRARSSRPEPHQAGFPATTALSSWAIAAHRRQDPWLAYAYDWAIPAQATATRVVMADRPPASHPGQKIVVVYGDGHFASLRYQGRSANPDAAHSATSAPDDARVDDIFTPDGDGGNPFVPGQGSATRAWLR